MNGRYPVDVSSYNKDVETYLLNRGAVRYAGLWTSAFKPHNMQTFDALMFPGCKPIHFGSGGTTRIFFPDEDAALLFSLAFGHLITDSYVKPIKQLIEEVRE